MTPTRRLYVSPDSGLVPGGSTNRHSVQTGGRAQVVSASPGVSAPGGTFSLPVAPDEIMEWLEIGMDGTPDTTTPGGGTTTRLHAYIAPGTPDSATLQWDDGARPWQAAGVYANALRVAGSADGDNTLSGDLFASALTQTALSGTVTDRNPAPTEGWETKLFLDSISGADNYGTTQIAAAQSIVNWDIQLAQNNLGRLYTAANTRAMQAAVMGVFEATGSITFVASGARALTEYNDFAAGTGKRMRLSFGNNTLLEGALYSFVDIDISLVWTEFTIIGEQSGVRTYEASFGYRLDTTNSLATRVRVQNARAAAWA